MPYILSPQISSSLPGLWGEGNPYERKTIYDLKSADEAQPPVHYDAHTLKPHSLTHIDAPGHIIPEGKTTGDLFCETPEMFFGPVTVVKLPGESWEPVTGMDGISLWQVTAAELKEGICRSTGSTEIPAKLFLTAESAPLNSFGHHDPNYVLVLEEDAAELLVSNPNFNAFGTSWKSCDFQPSSRERPIHKTLLEQAVLFEFLKLDHVPEGNYFLSGFPLLLEGATESPVCPVLFAASELPT